MIWLWHMLEINCNGSVSKSNCLGYKINESAKNELRFGCMLDVGVRKIQFNRHMYYFTLRTFLAVSNFKWNTICTYAHTTKEICWHHFHFIQYNCISHINFNFIFYSSDFIIFHFTAAFWHFSLIRLIVSLKTCYVLQFFVSFLESGKQIFNCELRISFKRRTNWTRNEQKHLSNELATSGKMKAS